MVNDRAAATFTLTGSHGHLLLPASVLPAADLSVPESAPSETIQVDAKDYSVRLARLPRLRFGSAILVDVPARILPPEAEHVGARISASALAGHAPRLEEERLWFRVDPGE